jgi:hypothetical protein
MPHQSGISSPAVPLPSSYASSVAAESEMGMVCSQEGGSAPTRVTDQPTHSPAGALSKGPSAPATPVLNPGIYTTWRDAPSIETHTVAWLLRDVSVTEVANRRQPTAYRAEHDKCWREYEWLLEDPIY